MSDNNSVIIKMVIGEIVGSQYTYPAWIGGLRAWCIGKHPALCMGVYYRDCEELVESTRLEF